MANLWVSQTELVSLLGADAARALCVTRGGISFYVPKEMDTRHPIAAVVGFAGLAALCAAFGGDCITVPNGRKAEPYKRAILRLLERGRSIPDIALEMGVTERYVRALAATMGKTRQLTLPLLFRG